jgi:hypothetical protein
MNEDKSNVVMLHPTAPAEKQNQREREARVLATLAALPALDYERLRLEAAQQLKCRVSWLDRQIRGIRSSAAYFTASPAQNSQTRVGDAITFVRGDGTEITGFLVASEHWHGRDRHLLVLADGNATVQISTPITEEQPAPSPKSPKP